MAHRVKQLEGHGTPAPALVNAWALLLKWMEAIPGIAVPTPEEWPKTAQAVAAIGESPSTVWLEVLQEMWTEEEQRT